MSNEYVVGIRFKSDGSGAVVTDFNQLKGAGDKVSGSLDKTDKAARRADKGLRKGAGGSREMGKQAGFLKGALAAIGFAAIAKSTFDTFRSFESMNASLKTVTGSTEGAKTAFKTIEKFAKTTPFNLEQSVQGFVKLKALGLDPSKEALRSYGNTAAAMGKNLNQMVEAVADASTGEFERLKEFGIKAASQGDDVSFTFQGVTTTVKKNSEEIQQYLLAIGNNQFGSAMADQMDTTNGAISNLQDSIGELQRKFFEQTGAADLAKSAISGLAGFVQNLIGYVGPLSEGIASFNENLKTGDGVYAVARESIEFIGSAFSSVMDFLGPVSGEIGTVLAMLAGSQATWLLASGGIALVATGIKTLITVLTANPIALIITGIALAAKLIYDNWEGISKFFTDLWATVKKSSNDAVTAIKGVVNDIVAVLKNLPKEALQVGKDLIAGFVQGVKTKAIGAVNAAKDMATGVLDKVTGIFRTQSPSLVMKEIGKNVGEGLAIGILLATPGAAQAAETMAMDVTNTFGVMATDVATSSKHTFGVLADDANQHLPRMTDAVDEADTKTKDFAGTLKADLGSALTGVILNGASLGDSLKSLWKRMAADFLNSGVSKLFSSLLSGKGFDFSGFKIGDIASKLFGKGGLGGIGKIFSGGLGKVGAIFKGGLGKIGSLFTGGLAKAGALFKGGIAKVGSLFKGGLAGLGPLAGVALVGGFLQNRRKKKRAQQSREFGEKYATGKVSGGFEGSSINFLGQGNVGKDGAMEAFAQATSKSREGMKQLAIAAREMGAKVWHGQDGLVKFTGEVTNVAALTAAMNAEGLAAMKDQEESYKRQIQLDGDKGQVGRRNAEAQKLAAQDMAKSIKLVNSADFSKVATSLTKNLKLGATEFTKLSKKGFLTAKEIGTHFGSASGSIISSMNGAKTISVNNLAAILSKSGSTAEGLKTLGKAGEGMGTKMTGSLGKVLTDMGKLEASTVAYTGLLNEIPTNINVNINEHTTRSSSGGSGGSGNKNGGSGGSGNKNGGGKATGGLMFPGNFYEVNEKGPELIFDAKTTSNLLRGGGTSGVGFEVKGSTKGSAQVDMSETNALLKQLLASKAKDRQDSANIETAIYNAGADNVTAAEDVKKQLQANAA